MKTIATQNKSCLLDEYPLLVLPSLACKIGINEAIFIQQVHYWLQKSGHEKSGRKWIYNTYEEWQKQFPFWSLATIRRTVNNLEKRGILLSGNFNQYTIDRTKWYTIDYSILEAIPSAQIE